MSKKAELEVALKEAMKANDVVRRNTLRMTLAAVKEAEVQKRGDLDDAAVLAILQKEVKSRQEAINEAGKANRPELAEAAQGEIAVLQDYLPQAMDAAELEAIVSAAIAESGAAGPADMGKVMKLVLPQLQGRADGSQVSQLVRDKLQS